MGAKLTLWVVSDFEWNACINLSQDLCNIIVTRCSHVDPTHLKPSKNTHTTTAKHSNYTGHLLSSTNHNSELLPPVFGLQRRGQLLRRGCYFRYSTRKHLLLFQLRCLFQECPLRPCWWKYLGFPSHEGHYKIKSIAAYRPAGCNNFVDRGTLYIFRRSFTLFHKFRKLDYITHI